MLAPELKSKINQLWDKFWSGGITNPITAIEQMSYLIFMKRLEDLDELHQKRALARKEKYESIFENNKDCKWSHWKHFSAEQMLSHVQNKVFPFIKAIRRGEDTAFAENMKDAVFIIPKPSLLQEAVSIIDELHIQDQNQDTQGDIYEYLLGQLASSGKNGQFRTPRHIIRLMAELVKPKIGEKICDPACGTVGFLIGAYEYILKSNTSDDLIEFDDQGNPHGLVGDKIKTDHWKILKRETLYGFDSDQTMVRIALMNLILHGIEHPNIRYGDSLSKNVDLTKQYDVILANPPFTGSIDKSDINDTFRVKTTKTELLFLELFYHMLHVGGRAAIVVPQGVLFGSSNAHVDLRKILLEKCNLEAVISLPSGVFQPYSGVATAIIVFTKGIATDKVWFYEMKTDGYSLDQKRNFIDGKGDSLDIIKKFSGKEESEQSFSVSIEKIKENDYNLNLSQYKKATADTTVYRKPSEIIKEIDSLQKEINTQYQQLKEMIK